jgi:hypothetical protein
MPQPKGRLMRRQQRDQSDPEDRPKNHQRAFFWCDAGSMRHGVFRALKSFAKFETNWCFIAASPSRGQRRFISNDPLQFKCVAGLNQVCLKLSVPRGTATLAPGRNAAAAFIRGKEEFTQPPAA